MFVSRILLDSFSDLSKMILLGENHQYCLMSARIGDVEQNDLLHKNSALEVTLHFKPSDEIYKSVFKGHNMAERAVEWTAKTVENYFELSVDKAAILDRLKPQIFQELSVISNK